MDTDYFGVSSGKAQVFEAARRLFSGGLTPARLLRRCARDGQRKEATDMLAVELGDPERLRRFSEYAALPVVSIINSDEHLHVRVGAPGATANNTEVRWDEPTEQLLVGVWSGSNPRSSDPTRLPPSELAWFCSVHLPGCRGQGARARITAGAITVDVPKCVVAQPRLPEA